MKLYTDPGNFQTLKIVISSSVTGCHIEKLNVKCTDCTVPYFSQARLPALEISDGKFLFSANVAAKYLWLKSGKELNEDAENEILEWENSSVLPCVSAFLVSAIGHGKRDKVLTEAVAKVLKQLDTKLAKTSFLFGESLSLSDVCLFSTLFPITLIKNCDVLDKVPNVTKWLGLCHNNPSVLQAVTEVTQGQGKGQDVFKSSLLAQVFPVAADSKAAERKAAPKDKPTATPSTGDQAQVAMEVVDKEEQELAKGAWFSQQSLQPKERKHPILPVQGERNVFICSALPYVNNVPHLGNIIGCVLSADIFSRYCRLRNYNVLYVSGTDEYGTATETKAMQEGVTPRQICDKYNALHSDIYKWFGIDFDHFGRTTCKEQKEVAQDIFHKLHQNGYVLKDSMDQLYCNTCSKFLADRFVEGTCPTCAFDDARGDQCDGCGKLINAVDLLHPTCKMCKAVPVVKTSNHLFLDLPKVEPLLRSHLETAMKTGTWTNNARVITNSWLRDGLKPRCISRDLKWGIPIPLEGYTDKVFYVWYDAPIGYISITASYTDQWKQWWKNPKQVELYHFLGKDNVPFHSVIFPSCLLGANDGFTLGTNMIATEYLNYEDTKFSKSRGTGVFGDQAASTGIPADVFRFYLLYLRPESQDTAFSWDDFLLKNNSELLNNLGNFINRSLSFLASQFGGEVQPMDKLTEEDLSLLALITREVKGYLANMESCRLRDGIRNILSISKLGNQYMQANKPWVLAKGTPEDRQRAGQVVSVCVNVSCLLSVLLQPYMPTTCQTIQTQLSAPAHTNVVSDVFRQMLPAGHKIGTPSPLFQKIEPDTIQALKAKFAGKQDPKSAPKTSSADPQEVARLTQAVTEQGAKVRELKAQKADKTAVDAAVKELLLLKSKLAAAGGSDPSKQAAGGDGKKKSKGKGSNPKGSEALSPATTASTPQAATPASSDDLERLTKAVTDQGNKVRDLKTSKAEKATIDAEVAALLALKRDLALAQGVDPDAAVGGGKKKGKKK